MRTPGQSLARNGKNGSSLGLSSEHRAILKMAHDRVAEDADLSFGEIAVALYGCRPERIGPRKIPILPLKDLLILCRLAPHDDFHFSAPSEERAFHQAMESVRQAVAGLVEKGLLETVAAGKLIWAKEEPRVEKIEYYQMVRLTEQGRTLIACTPCRPA